jgi:hypothetical protein
MFNIADVILRLATSPVLINNHFKYIVAIKVTNVKCVFETGATIKIEAT